MGKIAGQANEGKIWDGAGVLFFWVVVVLCYLATAVLLGLKMVALQAGSLGGISYTPVTLDQPVNSTDSDSSVPNPVQAGN